MIIPLLVASCSSGAAQEGSGSVIVSVRWIVGSTPDRRKMFLLALITNSLHPTSLADSTSGSTAEVSRVVTFSNVPPFQSGKSSGCKFNFNSVNYLRQGLWQVVGFSRLERHLHNGNHRSSLLCHLHIRSEGV